MGLHEAQKFWSSYYTKIKGGLCIYCNKKKLFFGIVIE